MKCVRMKTLLALFLIHPKIISREIRLLVLKFFSLHRVIGLRLRTIFLCLRHHTEIFSVDKMLSSDSLDSMNFNATEFLRRCYSIVLGV